MAWILPQELLDEILLWLTDLLGKQQSSQFKVTLYACARVSRAWLGPSRRRLFHSISSPMSNFIHDTRTEVQQLQRLLEAVISSARSQHPIGPYIHIVEWNFTIPRPDAFPGRTLEDFVEFSLQYDWAHHFRLIIDSDLLNLLRLFRRAPSLEKQLTRLVLGNFVGSACGVNLMDVIGHLPSLSSLDIIGTTSKPSFAPLPMKIGCAQTITHLMISTVSFTTPLALYSLLASLTHLRSLIICTIIYSNPGSSVQVCHHPGIARARVPPHLTQLDVTWHEDSQLLLAWLKAHLTGHNMRALTVLSTRAHSPLVELYSSNLTALDIYRPLLTTVFHSLDLSHCHHLAHLTLHFDGSGRAGIPTIVQILDSIDTTTLTVLRIHYEVFWLITSPEEASDQWPQLRRSLTRKPFLHLSELKLPIKIALPVKFISPLIVCDVINMKLAARNELLMLESTHSGFVICDVSS